MASTINADDGVISGSAGVKTTADSTGALNIQTNGTTAIAISSAQVVSFPSTSSINFTGSFTASNATLTGGTINNMAIGGTTPAAGAFTTLSASGNLTLSGGTANGVAYLNGSKALTTGSALTFDGTTFKNNAGGGVGFYGLTASDSISNAVYLQNSAGTKAANFQLGTTGILQTWVYGGSSWVNATTIDSSGNLGIGTSSPNYRLDVDSGSAGLMVNMNTANANGGYIRFQRSGSSVADVGMGAQIISGGSVADFGLNVRGANNLIFATNTLERARITSGGNLLVGSTSSLVSVSNYVGAKGYTNAMAGYVQMNGSTWVTLVTLPTAALVGVRINLLGNENGSVNVYYGLWTAVYGASAGSWTLSSAVSEIQVGNNYSIPNVRISGNDLQVQARNGVSSGIIQYNLEFFTG